VLQPGVHGGGRRASKLTISTEGLCCWGRTTQTPMPANALLQQLLSPHAARLGLPAGSAQSLAIRLKPSPSRKGGVLQVGAVSPDFVQQSRTMTLVSFGIA
jgi:hypothetical protein